MRQLRLASENPGKIREFREILHPLGFEIIGLEDLNNVNIIEDGDSFRANAIIKASTIMKLTGVPTIADDSGIVVDALNGKPGIYSARYAGVSGPNQDSANRLKLLEELGKTPIQMRTARFVCALAYCIPHQEPVVFEDTFEGTIGFEERGHNGFGYDPLFIVKNDTRTSAEIPHDEKNRISHRGKAINQLVRHLKTS